MAQIPEVKSRERYWNWLHWLKAIRIIRSSRSIRDAWGKKLDQSRVSDAQEISGHGVKVKIDGKMVLAGNGKLMDEKEFLIRSAIL